MAYITNAILVDAVRWPGGSLDLVLPPWLRHRALHTDGGGFLTVPTGSHLGTLTAGPGDWVVRLLPDWLIVLPDAVFTALYAACPEVAQSSTLAVDEAGHPDMPAARPPEVRKKSTGRAPSETGLRPMPLFSENGVDAADAASEVAVLTD